MDELIKALTEKKNGSLLLEGKKISGVTYEELAPRKETITAIDGGSAVLLETPSACVLFVRVVAARFAERKTIEKTEGYILATVEEDSFIVRHYPLEGKGRELFRASIAELETLSAAANLGRKLLEWELISEGITVWDGSLTATNCVEEEKLPRGEKTLGLSKTTGTLGNWEIFAQAPKTPWKAKVFDDTWFVKLHEKSKYYFRVEAKNSSLIDCLVPWSTDPAFFGYPYPLIFVDQVARVSNDEASVMKIRLQNSVGKDWDLLSTGSGTRDAHNILDSLQF